MYPLGETPVILGATKENNYNIRITAERTALTERQFCNETSLQPSMQKATFQNNIWFMKKHLKQEDVEQCIHHLGICSAIP